MAADAVSQDRYRAAMSLLCTIGRHQPSLQSISRGKAGDYAALCASCGVPLARSEKGKWRAAERATYPQRRSN